MAAIALMVSGPTHAAHAFEGVRYPMQVLNLTEAHSPFEPAETYSSHIFSLTRLHGTNDGEFSGACIKMKIHTLGEKMLLVDTAARGLMLKMPPEAFADSIHAPEWIRPGPGIQTGIFKLFPGISSGSFSMTAVIAELFWEKGFQGIDGILSTEILKPWVVSLNLPEMRMSLLSYENYNRQPDWELPVTLADNWWIAAVEISGKRAMMLLDTGASRTYLSKHWLRDNLSLASLGKRETNRGDSFFEAGKVSIRLKGAKELHKSVLAAPDEKLPYLLDPCIDGVLAFDVLREFTIDLDYNQEKIYLRHEK